MLVEGGGGSSAGAGASKPKPSRKPAPGVTRLQQYVAEPSEVDEPVAESPSIYSSSTVERLAAAYGQGEPLPLDPNSHAGALARGYGMMASQYQGTPVAEEPEAIKVDTADQEAEAKTYRARKSKEMSWDDYLGLSDRARAAVDFNTMLVQARQKDLRSDYEPNDAQREVYDKAVERMFGEEGVSETFAPETLALLNDVGFKETDAKRFDDLDDFLGLSAALTAKDIEKLGNLNPSPIVGKGSNQMDLSLGGLVEVEQPTETNRDVATMLAAGTADIEEALTRGNQVLENWKLVSAGTRNETLSFYGGTPNKLASPDIRLGENDEYFQLAFNTLADATNGPEVMELIRKDLGERDFGRFVAYADTKSQYSLDQQVGLGGDPAVQYRSPDEFRKILGLGGGGESDGSR